MRWLDSSLVLSAVWQRCVSMQRWHATARPVALVILCQALRHAKRDPAPQPSRVRGSLCIEALFWKYLAGRLCPPP